MNKKYIYLIGLLAMLFSACTDVIDVEVPYEGPRLVIEASLDWERGTTGNEQLIKLSKSIPYFDTTSSTFIVGAKVKVTNDEDKSVIYFVDQNNGNYTTDEFVPVLNQSYTLEVEFNGETYIAKESLISVVPINKIDQTTENGFDPNAIEVNIYFDDPVLQENYYLAKFQERGDLLATFFDVSDEYTNGNEMRIFYEKLDNEGNGETELQPGDIVDIELYGVSLSYFNYIRLIIEQNGSSGDPFSTIPASVRGNCVNITDHENYPFGYFRLTQVDRATYIVE